MVRSRKGRIVLVASTRGNSEGTPTQMLGERGERGRCWFHLGFNEVRRYCAVAKKVSEIRRNGGREANLNKPYDLDVKKKADIKKHPARPTSP